MKKLSIIFALFAIILTSCSKTDQVEKPAETLVTNAEFKVGFTVAESQSVNVYSIQQSENGVDFKEVAQAWPDSTKPENTFSVPVKYIGKAKVLYFKVVAINNDKVTSFETNVETVRL